MGFFVLEHGGRHLSRSALVRFTFGASPNHGFFHARLYNLISSPAPPGEVTDLSAYFAEHQPDLIIEGPKAMLKQRIEDAKQAVKQEQRKTAVGSQLRLSVGNQDTAPLCAPGVTWSAVGASFSAGLTIFADDNIWPALQRCLAASDWRGSIIRDSPQWVTVGCVDDHCLLALIRTLRAWREQDLLPADLRFRQWTLEYSHASPDSCCLISVQNGVIRSYSTTATARHIAAEISEDPLRRYLKAKQIAADVHISGVGPERRLEICGDVERLQGTTIFLTGLPPNRHEVFSVSFNATGPAADASLTTSLPPEPAAGDPDTAMQAAGPAADDSLETPIPPEAVAGDPDTVMQAPLSSDQVTRPLPHEAAPEGRAEQASRSTSDNGRERSPRGSSFRFVSGEVMRAPACATSSAAQPAAGLSLEQLSKPTELIRLLTPVSRPGTGGSSKCIRECWEGIKVDDEARIEKIVVTPTPRTTESYSYLMLSHPLAPEANVHRQDEQKHTPS